MPDIQFTCQHCRKPLTVPDAYAGKAGPCPLCKGLVTIPTISEVQTPEAKPIPEAAIVPPTPAAASDVADQVIVCELAEDDDRGGGEETVSDRESKRKCKRRSARLTREGLGLLGVAQGLGLCVLIGTLVFAVFKKTLVEAAWKSSPLLGWGGVAWGLIGLAFGATLLQTFGLGTWAIGARSRSIRVCTWTALGLTLVGLSLSIWLLIRLWSSLSEPVPVHRTYLLLAANLLCGVVWLVLLLLAVRELARQRDRPGLAFQAAAVLFLGVVVSFVTLAIESYTIIAMLQGAAPRFEFDGFGRFSSPKLVMAPSESVRASMYWWQVGVLSLQFIPAVWLFFLLWAARNAVPPARAPKEPEP